ncbi:MAG: peptide-methionine (S)-S-oxide reductase MsrA [Actinobacteria bacterium]|nr:peptide-methionine (S)-S-oxide reductase MsrA [Actinomycetota bacterium]
MRFRAAMIDPSEALPGRTQAIRIDRKHLTLGVSMHGPYPSGIELAYFGMGCFWGAERKFYETPGVYVTASGYQGGQTPNPTYQEVCSGLTNHNEVVMVAFDPAITTYRQLLAIFFENHDPTQGFRQGGDVGTQYRSAIYFVGADQEREARAVLADYQVRLSASRFGAITTEVAPADTFYFAEEYHQQYLTANPNGYCGIGGTGVSCPVGLL